jgi:hypothetical protein
MSLRCSTRIAILTTLLAYLATCNVAAAPPARGPVAATPPAWVVCSIVVVGREEKRLGDLSIGFIPEQPLRVFLGFVNEPGDDREQKTVVGQGRRPGDIHKGEPPLVEYDIIQVRRWVDGKELIARFRIVDANGAPLALCTGYFRTDAGKNPQTGLYERTMVFTCPVADDGKPLSGTALARLFLVDDTGYAAPLRVRALGLQGKIEPKEKPAPGPAKPEVNQPSKPPVKPKDDVPDRQGEAQRSLSFARQHIEGAQAEKRKGNWKEADRCLESARERLERLIKNYPETRAAKEARDLLETL